MIYHIYRLLPDRFARYFLMLCCVPLTYNCIGDECPPGKKMPNTCLYQDQVIISDIVNLPDGVTFDRVKAEIQGVEWSVIATVEATYADGKLTVMLPPSFGSEELCKGVRDAANDYDGFWPAEETDNRNARVAKLGDLFVYDGDKKVGRLFLTDWSREGSPTGKAFVYYHYADQPLTLGGYNLTAKAGGQKSYRYVASFTEGWCAYAEIPQSDGGINLVTTDIGRKRELRWRFE